MNLRCCPFCLNITYYSREVCAEASTKGATRVNCAFCGLKFWPGTIEDLKRFADKVSSNNSDG